MSEERSRFAQRINERQFTMGRRGYDKDEVRSYLEDLEQAFRELEGHARRTTQRVTDLERDLSKARDTEKVSVDNAMMAVFDAKDRILERARRRASEIEENAEHQAAQIRENALANVTGTDGAAAGEIAAARAQADEIVAAARREADRLRQEAGSGSSDELQAELNEVIGQLRRAHDDTASARRDLEVARKRIVELENSSDDGRASELENRFDELEEHLTAAQAEASQLRLELDREREKAESLQQARQEAEQVRDQHAAKLSDIESELAAERLLAAEARTEAAAVEGVRRELEGARTEIEQLRAAAGTAAGEASTIERLTSELHQSRAEVVALRDAAAAAESARKALATELVGVRSELGAAKDEHRSAADELAGATAQIDVAEAKSRALLDEIEALRAESRAASEAATAAQQSDAQLAEQKEHLDRAEFAGRMAGLQQRLAADAEQRHAVALVKELGRWNQGHEGPVPAGDYADQQGDVAGILEAARAEAEQIKLEVEEEAEQRAAKVIAKAREEADQVRQTVAELTAQADDARSVALRSKLEAEDLAQAQRAMSEARDDIVATAENRASEITADAEKEAATIRAQAEELLATAKQEARKLAAKTEELAQTQLAEAAEEAERVIGEAEQAAARATIEPPAAQHSGDELAAMLAEAEQELALSEEMRRQRRELEAAEAELAHLAAVQQVDAARLMTNGRDNIDPAPPLRSDGDPVQPPQSEVEVTSEAGNAELVSTPSSSDAADESELESDDPAERLSALLEQVAPDVEDLDDDSPMELDQVGFEELVAEASSESDEAGSARTEADADSRPRFAWPTPIEDDAAQDDDPSRESRYRSRSAQLPRLGDQAKSNMTSMANLRRKKRGTSE